MNSEAIGVIVEVGKDILSFRFSILDLFGRNAARGVGAGRALRSYFPLHINHDVPRVLVCFH